VFSGRLEASGFEDDSLGRRSGVLTLALDQTGTEVIGNTVRHLINTGTLQYTGSVCYEDFAEGNILDLSVIGEEAACSDNFEFPTQAISPDELICTGLNINPNTYTLPEGETTVPVLELDIDIASSDAGWNGTLIIEAEGECELFYGDRTSSEFADGRLEVPVNGALDSSHIACVRGAADDEITAYIHNEDARCSDSLIIEGDIPPPPPPAPVCIDLNFDPDELDVIDGDDADVEIQIASEMEDQTLIVEYEGCDGTIEYNNASYDSDLEINISGSRTIDLTLTNLCEDAEIEAYIAGEQDSCSDDLPVDVEVPEPGIFSKYIYTFNFSSEKDAYSDDGIFFSHDDDRVFYTLEYEPSGTENDIIFIDDMWGDDLQGQLGSGGGSGGSVRLATTYNELTSSSKFDYSTITAFGFGEKHEIDSSRMADHVRANSTPDDFETFAPYIKHNNGKLSEPIYPCDEVDSGQICYDQDESPERTGQVRIVNPDQIEDGASIRIRYVGIVFSGLDCGNTADECLTEQFENGAELHYHGSVDPLRAEARLVVLCAYLVTRNAGDVFLETKLEGGSDISCIYKDEDGRVSADYRNVDALVILDEGEDVSTIEDEILIPDYESAYSGTTISLCDDDEFSGNLIGNLSSYICEIVTSVNDLWKKSIVEQTTESRVDQATRNALTNQGTQNSFSDWNTMKNTLSNLNNPDSGILYFDGANSDTLDLYNLTIDSGAWTLIVENANLVIHGNIQYSETVDPTNVPSIAFVVLDGDIHIDNTARRLVGVYYSDQSITGDTRSAVNEPLEIVGSVYGHVQPLLNEAKYVGPAGDEGGGLVIRYDSRILINTPPGLADYVDISTENAVN
ncbi:hypothetical protein HOC00_04420, partial [Candidatus Peregrinibacteria bacterium]|nr:hypothetical protein [Candidatus Peregrinibacteria bacterium]